MFRKERTNVAATVLRALMTLGLLMGLVSALAPITRAANDTATLVITSLADDGVTPLPFARFQLTDSTGDILATQESAPPDGIATIPFDLTDSDLTYSVSMETPPACAVQPDDQGFGQVNDGDEIDLTFETSFQDDCNLGGISAYAYACPDGTDSSSTDYSLFQQTCTETQNDLPFSIVEKGGQQQSFSMTTGAYGIDGRAPLVGLVPGTYLLSSDSADADSILVYCSTYDGTPLEAIDPTTVKREKLTNAGAVQLKLKDRQRIACDFFSFNSAVDNTGAETPGSGNGTDQETPVDQGDVSDAADSASIEFHVATCPAGYDGSDYFNDCAGNGTDGVTFSVEGDNSGHSDTATSSVPTSPGFGIAVNTNLPADTYTMSEDVPGDFVSVFVYCAEAPGGGDRIPSPENGSQQFDLDVAEGQAIICDWYLTPDKQSSAAVVRVTNFTCEAGYTGTTFADFTGDCTDVTADVTFNLSNGTGYSTDKTTNSEGKVRFPDLNGGNDYVLAQDIPGDALDKRVAYCATDGGDYIEYGAETGSIDLDPIADEQDVQCLWYQVPTGQLTGNGSITIHSFECPGGTTGDYYNACHTKPLGGIDFNLDGPRGLTQDATSGVPGDDSALAFTDLPKGAYVITEDAADYPTEIYVVSCTKDGNAFQTTYDDSTGLRVNLSLPAGADVVCNWYSIPKSTATATPAPGGGNGSVTVVLRKCIKEAKEIENFANECNAYGAGVEFALKSTDGGSTTKIKTGTDSKAVFAGLKNGTYSLDQVNGDWCKAQSDHVDASGNVLVQNSGNTNVYIYNCGVKEINTLPATGTGPTSPGSGIPYLLLVALASLATIGGLGMLRSVRKPVPVRIRK